MRYRSPNTLNRRVASSDGREREAEQFYDRARIRQITDDGDFIPWFNEGVIIDGTLYTHQQSVLVGADDEPPVAPTNLAAHPGVRGIFLTWTECACPDMVNGRGYYELQHAEDAAFTVNLDTHRTAGSSHALNDLDSTKSYYFRVRGVDWSGNLGAWSDVVGPVSTAQITSPDIQAGTITADDLTATFTLRVGQYIESLGYNPGVSGWRIENDGTAEFNNVTVRGTIESSVINLGTGTERMFLDDAGMRAWTGPLVGGRAYGNFWVGDAGAYGKVLTMTAFNQSAPGTSAQAMVTEYGIFQVTIDGLLNTATLTFSQAELSTDTPIVADGIAQSGLWSGDANFARFGHVSHNTSGGYGYMQDNLGQVFLSSPHTVRLRNNNDERVIVSGATEGGVEVANTSLFLTKPRDGTNATQDDWQFSHIIIGGYVGTNLPGITFHAPNVAPQLYAYAANGEALNVRNNANTGWAPIFAANTTIPSSVLIKRNIARLDRRSALDTVRAIDPASYFRKVDPSLTTDGSPHVCGKHCTYAPQDPCPVRREADKRRLGFIAEEVEALLPEVTYRIPYPDNTLGIDYQALIPVLWAAVQELSERIDK